jgi:hypothetical protein
MVPRPYAAECLLQQPAANGSHAPHPFCIARECAPVVHIGRQCDCVRIVGDICANLLDEFKQAFGMCERPIFSISQSQLDDVIEGKLSFNYLVLLVGYHDKGWNNKTPPSIGEFSTGQMDRLLDRLLKLLALV